MATVCNAATSGGRWPLDLEGEKASDGRPRYPLLTTEPHEWKPLPSGGAFVFDGQLVGLRATELEDFGRLVDGQEQRKLIEHDYVLS